MHHAVTAAGGSSSVREEALWFFLERLTCYSTVLVRFWALQNGQFYEPERLLNTHTCVNKYNVSEAAESGSAFRSIQSPEFILELKKKKYKIYIKFLFTSAPSESSAAAGHTSACAHIHTRTHTHAHKPHTTRTGRKKTSRAHAHDKDEN